MTRALALFAGCACALGCAAAGTKGGLVTLPDEPGRQAAFAPRRFALLIGISATQDADWRPLKYADKDVADLAAALGEQERGRFDHVDRLTRPEETTREAILSAVRRAARQANRPDDILVVYVSAHGTLARDAAGVLRRYLVTWDARVREAVDSALSMDDLEAALRESASRRRVLVLATCHSGGGKSRLPQSVALELASLKGAQLPRPLEEHSRADVVLAAAAWGEPAREDDTLRNDVYTHFFVEALSGVADRNHDGAVTATEAHDWARRKTWDFSQGRQRPSAEIVEVGADPIVLAGALRTRGDAELYSYAARLDGFTVRVDGAPRLELPGGAALAPGAHAVELIKGDRTLLAERVTLDVGERLDLEALATRAEPRFTAAVTGGAWAFFDERQRRELLPPSASLGLSFRADRVAGEHLALGGDVAVFSSQQQLVLTGAPVPFTATSVLAGVNALWVFGTDKVSGGVGGRVAGLFLSRSFSLQTYSKAQSTFALSPGAVGFIAWRPLRQLEVSLWAQAMVSMVSVDAAMQVVGFFGGWTQVGYRF